MSCLQAETCGYSLSRYCFNVKKIIGPFYTVCKSEHVSPLISVDERKTYR